MTSKRAYKLQEFVAHTSSVNCLKIGRKSSRVLVTGGEDCKVNLWAIGKPNALLNLAGHTSAIESVIFDSCEVLVAAGAASGTIKLWDLEEAKIVRTLTGHRSNCVSVDFHPFGEFFASGSLDTNLKIWDLRRKGCIHTYKGHTRGVNAIRFTPDGRWVVSGGEDNTVKLWDLTAGKLLHDFKCHEGQIQCIDFHPNEFLLATGSADKTVKFWDLETFELIGSAGPETTGIRCMTFNPDGRTLLCGLHESLKVFSWEPVRCHDAVDVGWSKLSDLNVHEGKLLGCSYNQSCVGVWVVDIKRVEPYATASGARLKGQSEAKSTSGGSTSVQTDNSVKTGITRLSISHSSDPIAKDIKPIPSISPRGTLNTGPKTNQASPAVVTGATAEKRVVPKIQSASNVHVYNRPDVVPVIVPRTSMNVEQASDSRKEIPYCLQSKVKVSNNGDESERLEVPSESGTIANKSASPNDDVEQNFFPLVNHINEPIIAAQTSTALEDRSAGIGNLGMESSIEQSKREKYDSRLCRSDRDFSGLEVTRGGRTRTISTSWEQKERSPTFNRPADSSKRSAVKTISYYSRYRTPIAEETVSASDEDTIADALEQHDEFLVSMQSRLTKLQVIHRLWERNDIKGAIAALEKMSDLAVAADVISILLERSDMVTLEICTCLLPLLTNLLGGKMDRHLGISLEMLLKLVRVFGPVIHSTLSASSSVGVDLQAEQRLEWCNVCFIELKKTKQHLPSLTRRGGAIAKSAQELNLALGEVL